MSWQELKSVIDERRTEYRADRDDPPAACPFDGEPLIASPTGSLHCKFDGYQWPRDAAKGR